MVSVQINASCVCSNIADTADSDEDDIGEVRLNARDGPHADRGLLLWHSLGAPVVRGGASELGVSLVLPAGAGGRGPRSLDVLEEPARPVPGE